MRNGMLNQVAMLLFILFTLEQSTLSQGFGGLFNKFSEKEINTNTSQKNDSNTTQIGWKGSVDTLDGTESTSKNRSDTDSNFEREKREVKKSANNNKQKEAKNKSYNKKPQPNQSNKNLKAKPKPQKTNAKTGVKGKHQGKNTAGKLNVKKNIPKGKGKSAPHKLNVKKNIPKGKGKYAAGKINVKKNIPISKRKLTTKKLLVNFTPSDKFNKELKNKRNLNVLPADCSMMKEKTDCDFHVFHGTYKLSLDATIWDIYRHKKEKCDFTTWDDEEINIIVVDILMDEQENTQRILDHRHDRDIKENIKSKHSEKRNDKSIYHRQHSRFKREIGGLKINTENINTTIMDVRIQSFGMTKNPESYSILPKYENTAKRSERTGGIAPIAPKSSNYKAHESLTFLRPPLQVEQFEKDGEEIDDKVVRKTFKDRDYSESHRMNLYQNNEKKRKFFQESLFRDGQRATFEPNDILFKNFSELLNFVNTDILKKNGSHALLFSDKFHQVITGKMTSDELLSRLTEKSFNNKQMDGKPKFIMSHYVTRGEKLENNPVDNLEIKFHISPGLKSLISKTRYKEFFTEQVEENCLSIPISRMTVFQVTFPDYPQSSDTLLKSQLKLKLLDLNILSKERHSNLRGNFILQLKRSYFANLTENMAEENNQFYDSLKMDDKISYKNAPNYLYLTTSHPTTKIGTQIQNFSDKDHYSKLPAIDQQSIGIDYWLPIQAFLLKKLLMNGTLPQGFDKMFWQKTSTANSLDSAADKDGISIKHGSLTNFMEHRKSSDIEETRDNDAFIEPSLDIPMSDSEFEGDNQESPSDKNQNFVNKMYRLKSSLTSLKPNKSDEVENFHGIFRFKSLNDVPPDTRLGDFKNEKNNQSRDLLQTKCMQLKAELVEKLNAGKLLSKQTLHDLEKDNMEKSNFDGLFKLKLRTEIKIDRNVSSTPADFFHGVFRLKQAIEESELEKQLQASGCA